MDGSADLFLDLQYVVVVFLTLFAGTVLGLGLCGKARKPEKVDDPARRARMQSLMNRTDKAASEVEVTEARSARALAREGPGDRSKRATPRKQRDRDTYDDDDRAPRSRKDVRDREESRHDRLDQRDRSGSKRKKKTSTGTDSSRRRKKSRIYGVTESKRGQPSKENLSRDFAEPGQTPNNKTPAAEVDFKSGESKQRSTRPESGGTGTGGGGTGSPRNAVSPKRNAQSPRQSTKEHSRRTKVITFEKNNSKSKSRRSSSIELPVDVTQDDHSPASRGGDPEAFPFKDKSQASQEVSHKKRRHSPRGKTADFKEDETQTLPEDNTQPSQSEKESRVTRSRIRQIGDLPPGSPKKKHSSSVMTGVSKEESKRAERTRDDDLDRSKGGSRVDRSGKRSREGGSRLDKSDKSGKSSKSRKKGNSSEARKRASQEKHNQLKELRRSVNKKLKSHSEDPSAESPFGEKGKKTRKEDAEHKSKKVKVQSPAVGSPKQKTQTQTEQTEDKQPLALYPNTTLTRTEAEGDTSGKTTKTRTTEVVKVEPSKRKPPVKDADPDSQTGHVSSSSNIDRSSPKEQSSTAKTDPKEKKKCCANPRLRERTCQSPSVGVTFEGLPSRQRSDHTQEATLATTVTAADKTLTTQTAADSVTQTQKTQAATQSIGTGLNTLEMTAIQTEQTQKTKTTIAPTQVDPTASQNTQTTQKTMELVTAAERTKRTHGTQGTQGDRTEDLFCPVIQKSEKTQVDTKSLAQTAKSDARSQKTQVGTKTDEGIYTDNTQKGSDMKTAEVQMKSVTCKSSDYIPHIEGADPGSEKSAKVAPEAEASSKSTKKKKLSNENASSKKSVSTSSKKKPKKRKPGSKSVELEPPKDTPVGGPINQFPSSSSKRKKKKGGKVATIPTKNKAIDSLDVKNSKSLDAVDKPIKSGGTTAEGSVEKRGADGAAGGESMDTYEPSVEMPARKKGEKSKSKSIMAEPTQKSQKLDLSNKSVSSKIKSKAKSKLVSLMKSPQEKKLEDKQ